MQFSKVSGLQANLSKRSIYFGGVTQEVRGEILFYLGFSTGELPFKYLGIPLSSKKISLIQWQPLIEKIIARISLWTAKKTNLYRNGAISTDCCLWYASLLGSIIHDSCQSA